MSSYNDFKMNAHSLVATSNAHDGLRNLKERGEDCRIAAKDEITAACA